ncbi:AAA family ATPase [Pseudomonas fluorescens]|uniref:DUF3696 domain-containing protein n=1 Tax=Pseudomonas fluorescens TaxID=294 RepID=UPI00190604DA|nr:DUF3696 domain-containing protein [Pseudomonas fluorescens]MBD8091690.1 AAA family ATPase [Pseudomonas fluorescens]MBD8716186.1 AAA family ATPase [Pseudomonas fluorescens]
MKIGSFKANNYKAFESFSLNFKPLTILLGSNSSGKSAILNSLLMLSQSAESKTNQSSDTTFDGPLRLNGSKIGLGETLNIFPSRDTSKEITFSFSFVSRLPLLETVKRARESSLEILIYVHQHCIQKLKESAIDSSKLKKLISASAEFKPSRVRRLEHSQIEKFSIIFCEAISLFRKLPQEMQEQFFEEGIDKIIREGSLARIKSSIELLSARRSINFIPKQCSYSFKYDAKTDNLFISEFVMSGRNDIEILKVENRPERRKLSSTVFDQECLNRSRSEIFKLLSFDGLKVVKNLRPSSDYFALIFSLGGSDPFANVIAHHINYATQHLIENISNLQINHVSPLRAFPQRYYLLDKSVHHQQLNSSDGTELAEVLKNRPDILKDINVLFAPFNIGVDIEKINNIIHKIVVTQDKVKLELTDVGFGISQVLPILVQAYLSPKDSLTIIEQPEIHLHPNMQAWLADALIKIALEKKKKFLIETHSDALIRRLRLRIVDDSSMLTERDVNIYYLHREGGNTQSKLEEIEISPNGDLNWPKGFMDVEIKDTIQIQLMKSNKLSKGKSEVQHG